MAITQTRRYLLRPLSYILPKRIGSSLVRLLSRGLRRELKKIKRGAMGELSDSSLHVMLLGMDLAFYVIRSYRKNIENFNGRYLFRTSDNAIVESVTFSGGDMQVHNDAIDDWDVRVTFADVPAFWRFVFSKNQDILDSLLRNEVETTGNLNYIYKFGFMARDLLSRFGIG